MKQEQHEQPATLCGVPGVLSRIARPGTLLWNKQVWLSERRVIRYEGQRLLLHAEVRFDDQCKNKHNSFAITGHGWYDYFKARGWDIGGGIHEQIAAAFPELAHLIRWHLMDTSGPLHYVANTIYHATNLENGKAAGEPNRWETRLRFLAMPTMTFGIKATLLLALKEAQSTKHVPGVMDIVEVPYVRKAGETYDYGSHYTLGCYPVDEWYKAPYKDMREALEWQSTFLTNDWEVVTTVTGYAKGKERNLDAARSCAKWPEATDEQLMLPEAELKALLEARAPDLLGEFKAAVEATGCLMWEPTDAKV